MSNSFLVQLIDRRLLLISLVIFLGGCAGQSCLFKSNGPRPDWVDSIVKRSDGIYGVGVARCQKTVEEQKIVADLYAKRDLSAQVAVEVYSILESEQTQLNGVVKSEFKMKIREVTDLHLSFARIVERWQDGESCQIYSLAMVPMDRVVKLSGEVKESM